MHEIRDAACEDGTMDQGLDIFWRDPAIAEDFIRSRVGGDDSVERTAQQPRPLQHLHLAGRQAHVVGDDAGGLAQFAAGRRPAVEFDDAAVLLQAARVGLLDEEMRVVLEAHGSGRYPRAMAGTVNPRTSCAARRTARDR